VETHPLDNLRSLVYIGPELGLSAAILLVILWDLVADKRAKVPGALGIAFVALAFSAGTSAWAITSGAPPQNLFYGLLAFDHYASLFRILIAFVTATVLVFSKPSLEGERARDPGEFVTLLLVVTLGLNLMAASRNLLMIYLSLELVSVISFVLAGFKMDDAKSSEAALKYVVFGGVASGIMLYGMSFLFGVTQSLNLGEIATRVAELTATHGKVPEVVFVGVVCMLAGFGYKISAAPFHMWTPDVYEGAPTPVTAFLSVAPKAAGFAVLMRFFADALGAVHDAPLAVSAVDAAPWAVIIGCLAMATMTIGNLSALGQDNVKRMLAYSSIAHAGYMLLGFSGLSNVGVASIAFYVVAYCFMNLGAFLVVMAVAEQSGGDETIGAFKGLGRRAPVVAAVMTVFLFSLSGLPPMAGFVGKFYLFAALIETGGTWSWTVAVVGVLNSVVSLFYYARVIRAMYLETGTSTEPTTVRPIFGATSLVLAVPTLLLGVYWAPVYDFVARSLTMAR
jgi:NADH-quinone oxidoreductase subunit N